MPFSIRLRSLVSLSTSAQSRSDLIADLFDSTSAFHSYQSTMFHALMGLDVRGQQRSWCKQIQRDHL